MRLPLGIFRITQNQPPTRTATPIKIGMNGEMPACFATLNSSKFGDEFLTPESQ